MLKYCPIGCINQTEEICRDEACAWWSAYKACCSFVLFADTLAQIEEKLPTQGKPVSTNATRSEEVLRKARGNLESAIEDKEGRVDIYYDRVSFSKDEMAREAWEIGLAVQQAELKFMEELLTLLEEATLLLISSR